VIYVALDFFLEVKSSELEALYLIERQRYATTLLMVDLFVDAVDVEGQSTDSVLSWSMDYWCKSSKFLVELNLDEFEVEQVFGRVEIVDEVEVEVKVTDFTGPL
jgi:hypothetical protein